MGWLRRIRRVIRSRVSSVNVFKLWQETDALYRLLYTLVHDLDESLALPANSTRNAFANQWSNLPEGNYLLSDPWFRENVSRILSEEEIQLKREWFKGKRVLDVGCGNGRWSYGFAKLGAIITCVDVNQVAVDRTREVLKPFGSEADFCVSALEDLSTNLATQTFDLVFCWGVLHHCRSFNKSLDEVLKFVKNDGVLYLYLYGRESLSYRDDLALFKERVRYNSLLTDRERMTFLKRKARGDMNKIHGCHDIYAPLINRRLEFEQVAAMLYAKGFEDVTRTIDHTELFIRAIKSDADKYRQDFLPTKQAPYWFQHH